MTKLFYCIVCGNALNTHGRPGDRCQKCWGEHNRGENHSQYKPSSHYDCISCGKSCRVRGRLNPKYCWDCYVKSKPNNGNKNNRWNGGKVTNSHGYVLLLCKDHPRANDNGYVPEHQLVMEKHISRYLIPPECVHHVNKIKSDNRIENLRLCSSNSDHILTYHSKICSICSDKHYGRGYCAHHYRKLIASPRDKAMRHALRANPS